MKFELVDEPVPSADFATVNNEPLELIYTKMQDQVFLQSKAKYTVVSAGRRSGKTKGAAQFMVENLLGSHGKNFLWCEVSYGQILTYYDRYFYPLLIRLKPELWSWNQQRRDLKILDNTLSFRSADRPDLLVGLGYSMLVINECGIQFFEYPEIWQQILSPMLLDDPESRCWMIGTPRGLVDKSGKENLFWTMYEKGQHSDTQDAKFKSFKFTSYDNPFLDKDSIKDLEDEVPALLRAQELYAEFINVSELQIFKPEWWRIAKAIPEPHYVAKKFISVDSAFSEKTTADESAATVWIKTWTGEFYCIDAWHDHVSYPDLVTKIKELINRHNVDVCVVENKASGQSLIQTLRNDISIPVAKYPQDGVRMPDKVNRATSITSYMEAGKVYLLDSYWTKDIINQATVFPLGSKDDLVDTISMALLWAKLNDTNVNPFVTRKIQLTRVPQIDNPNDTLKAYSSPPTGPRGF